MKVHVDEIISFIEVMLTQDISFSIITLPYYLIMFIYTDLLIASGCFLCDIISSSQESMYFNTFFHK